MGASGQATVIGRTIEARKQACVPQRVRLLRRRRRGFEESNSLLVVAAFLGRLKEAFLVGRIGICMASVFLRCGRRRELNRGHVVVNSIDFERIPELVFHRHSTTIGLIQHGNSCLPWGSFPDAMKA